MKNLYQTFPTRLTRWMEKEKLPAYTELFHKYHGADCHGTRYLIKSNRKKKNPKYAIFIKADNKLRREEDFKIWSGMSLINMLMAVKPMKQEGISIFKTLMNYL